MIRLLFYNFSYILTLFLNMKNILFLFVFLLPVLASAQDVNQLDADGKRHGIWKKNFENTKILRYQGEFFHGKEIGVFTFYLSNRNNIDIFILLC